MAITISGDTPNFSAATITAATITTGTVTTLNAPSGVLATQNGMTGICKAWVNFNGGATPSIRASFNVSSVTFVSTGYYTVALTTAMADANYVINYTSSRAASGGSGADVTSARPDSTTGFTLSTFNTTPTAANTVYGQVAVFGN